MDEKCPKCLSEFRISYLILNVRTGLTCPTCGWRQYEDDKREIRRTEVKG